MKRILTVIVVLTLTTVALPAQEPAFGEGDLVFNAAVGIGSTLYTGARYSMRVPAISLSGEYGIADDIGDVESLNLGVGAYASYSSSEYKETLGGKDYGWRYNYMVFGARGSMHYTATDNLDTYLTLMLGYNLVTASYFGDDDLEDALGTASASSVTYGASLGARYYFTNNLGVMAEVGYGIAWLNLGVALKL